MQSALLLLFLVAFQASLCEWSTPVKLLESRLYAPWVASIYRDPSTSLNHAIICASRQYRYLAVKDDGSVVHNRAFSVGNSFYATGAVIKGADNGKNLFVALKYSVDAREIVRTVNFTESKDGGENWTVPVSVLAMDGMKVLLDMLYISETGRIIIFFSELKKHDLGMVSRPANSSVFSGETIIIYNGLGLGTGARAAYTSVGAKQYIYIAYVTFWGDKLMYLRSTTNGADWSTPIEIASGDKAWQMRGVIAGAKLGSMVYIVYAAQEGPEKLLVSSDRGVSFGEPVPFTLKASNFTTVDGVAACAAEGGVHKLVALSRVENSAAEYAIWDTKKMEATRKRHPFESFRYIATTGVECAVDAKKKQRVTPSFAVVRGAPDMYNLYFAVDREAFDA